MLRAYRCLVYRIFPLVLGCWLYAPGFAQRFVPCTIADPEPSYRTINASNGLPSSESYDVLQDRDGYIWISTDRGVVRYDGFRFKTFTTKNGLADDVIFKLYEDPRGRVWFVSFSGLLSYYENGTIKKYRYNNRIRRFIGNVIPTFKSLIVDKSGSIYYAIYELGGITIDASGNMKRLPSLQDGGTVARRYADGWLPLCSPDKPGQSDWPVRVFDNGAYHWLGKNTSRVARNTAWNDRHAFLQTENDVYDLRKKKLLFREEHVVIAIDCIGDEVFAGTYKNGVRRERLDIPNGQRGRTSYLLPGYSVSSVLRDREGGYWFTTLENGVFYTPNLFMNSYKATQGFRDMEYSMVGGLGKNVYICDLLSCTKITRPCMRVEREMIKSRGAIGASRNKVYIGLSGRETKAAADGKHVFVLRNRFHFWGGDDYILATGASTIRIHDDGRIDTLYLPPAYNNVRKSYNFFYAVMETPEGRVFVGNLNGLYELRNGEVLQAHLKDPLFRQRVVGFAQHPKLKTIVATRNSGVYCFDEHYRVTQVFTRKDGLLSDLVNCVYVDSLGYIYIGTNRGLTILQQQPGGKFRHWIVTTNQGLCSNEINCVYRTGRSIYVATKEGVSVIDLDEVEWFRRGGIGLADFSVNGKSYTNYAGGYFLPSDVELIRVAIRTSNYAGIGRHRFAYRLRRGGNWVFTSDPEIALNEPRFGDYEISVKFRNDTGAWSRPVQLIRFRVEKPYYATWYFIVFVSLLFVCAVSWIFKTVLRRVKQRHEYQTTINRLEQKALRAQMNPHFIFNSLNSIQSFLVYEENEKAERYLLKFAQLIRQTLNNSRESYITIASEMETLQGYLELEKMRFGQKFDFAITSNLAPDELLYGVPPMMIQPFVENAVLHGFRFVEAGGKVALHFEAIRDKQLLCIVDDNGVGRKATQRPDDFGHKSFGTRITEERLAAFRQKYGEAFTVEIIDKEANGKPLGTKVIVKIPVVAPDELTSTDEK